MNKPTHDFLSLSTSFQHNTDGRSGQGYPAFPMTHDFLQPQGRVGKNATTDPKGTPEAKEQENPKEHVLPCGIGTYSAAHMGPEFRKRSRGGKTAEATSPETPKADIGKAPGSSSSNPYVVGCAGFYASGAFTLWQETGGSGGDKRAERPPWTEPVEKAAEAYGSAEKVTEGVDPQMSSLFAKTNFAHRMAEAVQRPSQCERQRNQGFVETMKIVKVSSENEEEDEECADQSRDTKRESSSQRGDAAVRSDGKSSNQRANTPRSKHSATEQRRRSKINDRFQILREIVPHSDQKRDKASFLLEVIEYIQSLQERVHKYETPYQEWDEEKMKMMAWNNKHGPIESDMDRARAQKNGQPLLFGSKFDEGGTGGTYGTSSIVTNSPNLTLNVSSSLMEKKLSSGPSGYPNKTVCSVSLPISPALSPSVRNVLAHQHQRLLSDPENVLTLSQSQSQYWPRSCLIAQPLRDGSQLAGNEHQDLVIEDGLISVSSVYSRELLGTLNQTLHNSGVDLSQANISVQINLGKRGSTRPSTTTSSAKDREEPPSTSNHILMHSRPQSGCGGDPETARKRPKTERDL